MTLKGWRDEVCECVIFNFFKVCVVHTVEKVHFFVEMDDFCVIRDKKICRMEVVGYV